MKLEVNLGSLKRQKELLLEGKPSQLAIGMQNYTVEPLLDEPNYDLLPQSEHGRMQTGEEVEVIEQTETLPPVDKSQWLDDPNVIEKFKALAEQVGQPLTKPRMKATADKFEDMEGLLAYLDEKLTAGTTQPQA